MQAIGAATDSICVDFDESWLHYGDIVIHGQHVIRGGRR
jgi:hypothetical protein